MSEETVMYSGFGLNDISIESPLFQFLHITAGMRGWEKPATALEIIKKITS